MSLPVEILFTETVVGRLDNGKYFIDNIKDEPLTLIQLSKLLDRLDIPQEELSMALLSFKENPHHKYAFFAVTGRFRFSK